MKVKDKWFTAHEFDIESALLREMQNDAGADGRLEQLQCELSSTQQVLARFMAQHIKSITTLNAVVGYNKYEEV